MKKTTFLALLTLVSMGYASAQTIPFGFRKSTVKRGDLAEQSGSSTTTAKSDQKIYEELRDKQQKVANEKKAAVDAKYQSDLNDLGVAQNASEETVLEAKKSGIYAVREAGYKEIKALERMAGKWDYLSRTTNRFNWFFVRNSTDAEMYYNGRLADKKEKFLSNSLISFSSDGGKASIYNELYADYFGPVRFGFGALISNKQGSSTTADPNEKKEDAVQRLLGGGGNGVINMSYPLVSYELVDGLNFKTIVAPKFALDVPKIGTDSEQYAFSYSPGLEGSVYYTGALDVLTFYSNFRFGITGGNSLFYQNLNKTDQSAFAFNQVSLGVAITSTFRVNYNKYFGSTFVKDNFPASFSFVFIPN